jgi:membrane protein required for colicin V production
LINLNTLDWVMLAVLALSMLLGVWRGLVHEVLAIVGWVAAFVLAQMFSSQVGHMINIQGVGGQFRYMLGFAAVFIGTLVAGGLLTWVVKKMISSIGLTPIDRTLGAAFGALRGVLILLVLTTMVLMTPLRNSDGWTQSAGAGVLSGWLKIIHPILPKELNQYIQTAAASRPCLGLQICVES